MRKYLLSTAALVALLALSAPGWAACPSPYTAKDAGATSRNIGAHNDASDNCVFDATMETIQGGATGGVVKAQTACDSHVYKHITSATDTLAVQGVTSQTVRICGVKMSFAGTATAFLENTASTNANCSSTLTQITGVVTGAANYTDGFYSPFWGGLSNTSGNGLCINSTGTGGVDVDVWYAQF